MARKPAQVAIEAVPVYGNQKQLRMALILSTAILFTGTIAWIRLLGA